MGDSQGKQKPISIQELKRILKNKNIELQQEGNWIFIKREPTIIQRFLGANPKTKKINIKNQKEAPPSVVEDIRNEFGLSFNNDGFDNIAFYNDKEFISVEITAYKKIIYKLAKT